MEQNLLSRTELLTRAADLLRREREILASRDWARLPELKKEKMVLAGQLRGLDVSDVESPDSRELRLLIGRREEQSMIGIEAELELIAKQIAILQDAGIYWREILSVSLQKVS